MRNGSMHKQIVNHLVIITSAVKTKKEKKEEKTIIFIECSMLGRSFVRVLDGRWAKERSRLLPNSKNRENKQIQ